MATVEDLSQIDAPREWQAVLEILSRERGIAIILGATDTGKSTLAKFLIFNLCQQGLKIGLVDADIGQSFLGPPSTIGFALFKTHPDWGMVLSTPEIFFVGSVTPEGFFPTHLTGAKRMLDKAISYNPEVILIDTTGYISGEGGKELKRRKIDLLSPRFILAIQKSDEVEPILKLYDENPLHKIFRLPLSNLVRAKSMEERRDYRTNKFRDYFKGAVFGELPVDQIRIEGEVLDPNGDILPLEWALRVNGLLVGLKDRDAETLALGLIRNYQPEKKVLRILTPYPDLAEVKAIQLSSLKMIPIEEQRV
jgi:polynucleotide 5'-hydroxyl-kinase GRC3/NOL9